VLEERMWSRRLVVENVESNSTEVAGFQRDERRIQIDERTATAVDEDRLGWH
jgi:hypothetical protein